MNNDLISREAFKQRLGELYFKNYGDAIMALMEAPAVDAVEVVRCKDCLWFKKEKGCPIKESGYFKSGKMLPLPDDFCSYGERREENEP